MVWNVLGKDFKMAGYDTALKRMHRFDSIKKECQQWTTLLSKLTFIENEWENPNHVSHSETGIVYDLRVVRSKIDQLTKELDDLEEYS